MANIIHPTAGNYFLDTEFFDPETPGFEIDFFSIGLVSEGGRSFYGVSNEFNDEDYKGQWVYDNVINKLPPLEERMDMDSIRAGLIDVFEPGTKRVDIWAKNGAYDHYVLSRFFPRQLDFKAELKERFGIERVRFRDTNELLDVKPAHVILPVQTPETEHISGEDAHNEREVFLAIKKGFENMPKPSPVQSRLNLSLPFEQ